MRKVLIAAGLMMTCAALAQSSHTLTWAAPTQYVDGTNIPAGALDAHEVRCTQAGKPDYVRTGIAGSARTITISDATPGTWVCTVRVSSRGLWSDPSNSVSFTVPQPITPPRAPVLSLGG